MKLTIDTKEDSYDDIKKVLQILTHIIQNKDSSYNPSSSPDTTNMMNMFGDDDSSPSQDNDRAPNFGSFLNLTKNSSSTSTSKREESPKIEFF